MARITLGFVALGFALTITAAAEPAAARTRGFCNVPIIGDIYQHPCGGDNQIACQGSSPCDSGRRHVTFSGVTIDCIAFPDETISGACTPCGAKGEIGCGGSSPCSGSLALATTSGLDGSISQCGSMLPPDPENININVPSFTVGVCPVCATYNPPNVNINLPSSASIVSATGVCSEGKPENIAGASREVWPSEPATQDRGTTVFVHGRGSSCSGKDDLLHTSGGGLFELGHRTYCVEYDRGAGQERSVVVYEPTEQSTGEGPAPCAANGTCTWDLGDPVLEVTAPSYSVPGIAAAVAEALQTIPIEGEITLIGHSQGGFIVRALLHEHYDELRWAGEEIARAITLGHPYYGKVVDPLKVTPWMCIEDSTFDCQVQEWLWGWKNWLGSTAGNIDDVDFPEIEWSAVAGDGLNSAGTGPGGTAPESVSDECLEIFGGIWRPSIVGDTSVGIASSLGIDERGHFPVSPLAFDDALSVRCAHNASCLLGESLAADPGRIPVVAAPGLPLPGALAFDGVDDVVGGLDPAALPGLEMTDTVTIEAWIWPDGTGGTGIILEKEGEYTLSLRAGELAWAVANSSPGWAWTGTGFFPPRLQWTHVALVYDALAGVAKTFVDGAPLTATAATGTIGDARSDDDLRIGGRDANPEFFPGRIDEVRLWSSARTDAQIREGLGNAPDGSDPDLRGWWTFDEGGGDAVLDGSSYAHDLSLAALGAAPVRRHEDRTRDGGAMYFDGVDDRVTVTDPAALSELEADGALTIEAWVYPRGPGGHPIYGGAIVNKEGEYALARMADGTIAFSLANGSPGWVTMATAATAPEHTWTHVALVFEDGANGIKIFENGQLVDSMPGSGTIGDQRAEDELWIGGRQQTNQSQWFHGVVDEVRVWSTRRTDGQIAKFYDRKLHTRSEARLAGSWSFDEVSGALVRDASSAAHHASRGTHGAATTPTRSLGSALPGYPAGLFLPPPPKTRRCGMGAELVLVLPPLFLALHRSRRRRG